VPTRRTRNLMLLSEIPIQRKNILKTFMFWYI
jgi:hypothetical protein